MDDEWVVLGTALGLKNAQHSIGVQCIGRQTVDRFGRDAYHLTRPQQVAGFLNIKF